MGIYVILDKGEKGQGCRGLRFQRKWAIYRSLRRSGKYIAGEIVLGNPETMRHRGYLVNMPLLDAFLAIY